ncbi:MAG: hypothetical protein ACRDY0_02295 [Acidimicrobiales bacterium]
MDDSAFTPLRSAPSGHAVTAPPAAMVLTGPGAPPAQVARPTLPYGSATG